MYSLRGEVLISKEKFEKYKDKWFNVENYIKYLCDRERSLLKREVKK